MVLSLPADQLLSLWGIAPAIVNALVSSTCPECGHSHAAAAAGKPTTRHTRSLTFAENSDGVGSYFPDARLLMVAEPNLEPMDWARQTFGAVQLDDRRRLRRAVDLGAALLANPAASLPQQVGSRAPLDASYTLVHEAGVTHTGMLTPHWSQTREQAGRQPLVLLTGDSTILDYGHHLKTKRLGPIDNGRGPGYVVHSVLAIGRGFCRSGTPASWPHGSSKSS